jgi:hypothetical protein
MSLVERLRSHKLHINDIDAAADALEAQARRIAELEEWNLQLQSPVVMQDMLIEKLRARIAELKAALKPFADAGSFTKTYEYSEDTEMAIPFTWGQLRTAHAAYLGEKE